MYTFFKKRLCQCVEALIYLFMNGLGARVLSPVTICCKNSLPSPSLNVWEMLFLNYHIRSYGHLWAVLVPNRHITCGNLSFQTWFCLVCRVLWESSKNLVGRSKIITTVFTRFLQTTWLTTSSVMIGLCPWPPSLCTPMGPFKIVYTNHVPNHHSWVIPVLP